MVFEHGKRSCTVVGLRVDATTGRPMYVEELFDARTEITGEKRKAAFKHVPCGAFETGGRRWRNYPRRSCVCNEHHEWKDVYLMLADIDEINLGTRTTDELTSPLSGSPFDEKASLAETRLLFIRRDCLEFPCDSEVNVLILLTSKNYLARLSASRVP